MKNNYLSASILGVCVLFNSCAVSHQAGCFPGAFLADAPSRDLIEKFEADYGKRPAVILTFLDWGKYPAEPVIRDVYGSESVLMLTWEPWHAETKQGIDYDAVLKGMDDPYILEFANRLKAIGKPVFLRFAHEMNGDWYPWAAQKIGSQTYQRLFKHVRGVFDRAGAGNVRWVFSINAENVPRENIYDRCYPGSRYVDYVGLDGYNWGATQSWSRWQSFQDIFSTVYSEVVRRYRKPVIISEFGSTSVGGDKAIWIEEALRDIRRMPEVKAFVLFNVNKETDWFFVPGASAGLRLREGLAAPYFSGIHEGDVG